MLYFCTFELSLVLNVLKRYENDEVEMPFEGNEIFREKL